MGKQAHTQNKGRRQERSRNLELESQAVNRIFFYVCDLCHARRFLIMKTKRKSEAFGYTYSQICEMHLECTDWPVKKMSGYEFLSSNNHECNFSFEGHSGNHG